MVELEDGSDKRIKIELKLNNSVFSIGRNS